MSAEVSPITALVIEDSPTFAKAVALMLERYPRRDTRVELARTLAAAVIKLQTMRVDIVILDLSLPDSLGIDSLVTIRAVEPIVPVIVLSGLDDETVALQALSRGAQDYLLKTETNSRSLNRAVSYALARAAVGVLEAEKLRLYEQREDFMATLTHDLKNPLIGANRILELMIDQQLGPLSEQHVRLLSKLKESNCSLLAMIKNLIEVYRFEKDVSSLVLESTDLGELVSAFLDEIQPLISDRRIRLRTELAPPASGFLADRTSIGRVVQNLIQNAIKFTPEGGSILVKLWEDGRRINFMVQDSGPGISKEEMSKLFQRFWRGNSGRIYSDGTGLGLYLCRQIVEAHEGQIWCSSEPEQGSTFTVSLPLAQVLN